MRTSFADRLASHAADASAPPAIVLPDAELSYAELHRRVEHCAAWMRSQGFASGDVAGITVADEIAHLTISQALLVLGLPQVCLPSFEPQAVRLRLARALGVTRVVAVKAEHGLPGISAIFVTPAFLAESRAVPPQDALNADPGSTALFVASSGSTGEPKLIAISARVLTERQRKRGLAPRERTLVLTTVEDIFGKSSRLNCTWLGVTSVFRASTDATPARALAAFCSAHRVTRLNVNVLQASGLVHDDCPPLPAGLDVFASGSRVPMRLREAFRSRGLARLHVEFGTREVGLISTTFPDDCDPSQESAGLVVATAAVDVVDADGRPLPAGEIGEIRVRTEYMVNGYYRNPAATARNFRDDWFYTGDLGSFTSRGSLCLSGRLDDVMNLGGIKVYPAEIERVLEDDPAVRTAAAFALRSDVHGEIPVAAIEWQGRDRPDVAALMTRVRALLGVRSPRKILLFDELPRTATGKVAKLELARIAEAKK